MTETASPASASSGRPVDQTLQLLRAIGHLAALVTITWWALAEWPLPWPGLLAGIGFFALTVLIWALFLSPRPVLRTDRFGRSLVELLLIAGAVGALLGLGAHWLVAVLLGLTAAVLGYLANARS